LEANLKKSAYNITQNGSFIFKVAQEELGWGAAWGMSGVKFAMGCYWVTRKG
jgi:hypothetical protein